ncbi:MAG: hypothetical protein EA404_13365 [Spirochaetaceae bacterium]|nr:MAG: hypothetical protein EA404_13365 [Spirochaetaceae bacterium]
MKQNQSQPSTAALLALCLLYAVSLTLFFLLPAQQRHGRIWSGYYLLLVDPEADCEQLVERLNAARFERVIAACTATVALNRFGSLETVPLPTVAARLDPVDPRLDPYIRSLPDWFRTTSNGQPAAIVYLASEENPWLAYRSLAAALNDDGTWWHFAEWDLQGALVFSAVFGLIALLLIVRGRGYRTAALAAALPWLPWLVFGGLPAFGVAVSVYCSAVGTMEVGARAVRDRRNGPLLAGLAWLTIAVAVSVLVYPGDGFYGRLAVVAGSSGTAAAVLALLLLRWRDYRLSEHRLFTPLPITRTRRWRRMAAPGVLRAVLVLALAAPLLYAVLPQPEVPHLPEPEPIDGDHHNFETLHRLADHRAAGALPNLSDYVAHRAFQEAFMYRRDWGVPQQDEVLTRPRFVRNQTQLERSDETIVEYTRAWLDRVLRESPRYGVEAILLAQPAAVQVVRRPKTKVYFGRSFLARHAILMIVVAAPYFVYAAAGRRASYSGRALLQRSNRHYA